MTRDEFEAYVKSSQKGLRRFLTALCCGDSQLADDIAQDTYIKANPSCSRMAADEFSDGAFQYQELYTALERLNDNERMTLLLYYMQDYSIKEISGIMEITRDAVRQHLSRGRRHLHDLIKSK